MSKEVKLHQNSFRLIYYKYKDSPYIAFGLVVLVFSVCLMLFFRVVMPQVDSWFSIRDEVIATRERIDVINRNINFMKNVDNSQLNTQVNVSTEALPTEKGFAEILDALSTSAVNAGVALDDYTFQVGSVASSSGLKQTADPKEVAATKLTVVLAGTFEGVQRFLNEIAQKLPVSEFILVDGDTRSTTVTLQFYQKNFPQIVFKDDQPIIPLSDKHLSVLGELSSWRLVKREEIVANDSAIPLF
jgi:hypothetical protein